MGQSFQEHWPIMWRACTTLSVIANSQSIQLGVLIEAYCDIQIAIAATQTEVESLVLITVN